MIIDSFLAYTIGILVFLVGSRLNRKVALLREFNIPEPVTGGLLAALVVFGLYGLTAVEVSFDLATRDLLLVYFFTSIGLNARFSDLVSGGRPLVILLVLTLLFIVVQTLVGMGGSLLLDLPSAMGVLVGSAALIGGHGTAIAWAPEIAANNGVPNALEVGVAAATLGLVIASLIGGPIARFLINRHKLSGNPADDVVVGVAYEHEDQGQISHLNVMSVILAIHVAIILGYMLNMGLEKAGFKLPLFVSCLLVAILLSNTVPYVLPGLAWPARTKALAILSDFSLGLFLAMSLMSMQLWTIAGLAGPLLIILALQTIAALLFIIFVLFPLMGRDYQAAVLSAGFGGFALGATPTAIANMTAVTKANGPAPTAFIILPLVSAFFVDVTNAIVIKAALGF